MPIPFRTIPDHVRNIIVQKLDAHDFGQFQECSKLAYNAANKIRTKLVVSSENVVHVEFKNGEWEFRIKFFGWFEAIEWTISADLLENTSLRIVATEINIQGSITQEMCEKLTETLSRTYSSFGCLRVFRFLCTADAFNNLLMASNARKFVCSSPVPKEYVKVDAMKNIDDLEISSVLEDEDLLSLKMSRIHLYGTNITNFGLNLLIHEYMNGKRDFTEVYVQLNPGTIDEEIICRGINVLPKVSSESTDTPTDKPKSTENRRQLHLWNRENSIKLRPNTNNN